MSNTKEPVKIVSLDSLDYIKTYIDTRSSEINNIISDLDKKYNDSYNTLSEETIELLNSKISEAKDSLTESFDSKYDKLKEELESATDAETIKELQDSIALLETEYTNINVALDKIKQDIEDGKSIFTEQEANELVETAFINGITMDDESGELSAEKLLTKKIVALIANFGSVKAESIESGEISGSTITSLENAPYKDIPMWGLYPDGSGHLAGGEINWDNSGNVTFGDNVTLSWNNITNKDDALNSISEDIENNIYDKHASALTNAIESAKVELNYKIDDELAKAREEQEKLSNELSSLEDTVNTYDNTINNLSSTINGLSGKIHSWEDDSTLSPNELQQLSSDFEKLNVEHNSFITDINDLNNKLENWAISVEESETPISELDSNDIRNLKINIDNDSLLIQKYNIAKSVYEYYTKSEKDENNCILISEEYPLLSLAEYYATKSVYLLKYQEASTEYLTNNRFGSKTTWIGSDGLYSGTITGDNIVGIRLAGKTIESSSNCNLPENVTWKKYNNETVSFNTELGGEGPTWQISDSGSGHLASGNISWDSDGDVTFGPGVTLSWSQLDDAEDNVNDLVRRYDDRIINRRINDVRDVIYDEIRDNKNELELSISQINEDTLKIASDNLIAATQQINDDLISAQERLQAAIESGDAAAIAAANGALAKAEAAESSLTTLQTSINDRLNGFENSILSSGDIENLSIAAIQTATEITGDTVASQTIIGQNIIGLAGTFAEVQAEKITGSTISGKTIESTTKIGGTGSNKNNPTWQITNNGAGYLAKGNISWDDSGEVTFGSNVTLSWNQLDDKPADPVGITGSSVKYATSASREIAPTTGWGSSIPSDAAQRDKFIWTKTTITYSDNSETVSYSVGGKGDKGDSIDEETIRQAVSTEISNYKVKSHEIEGNLFSGKTFVSSKDDKLVNGTTYVTYSEPDSNGNYTFTENTAGDNTTSNAWQIRDDGTGYLSSGKFSWDATGGITITDNEGYKAKLGGDSAIELLNNENTAEVSLNYSGLHIGSVDDETTTTIIRGRIGLSDSNNIVDISTSNNAARFVFGNYSIVISNTGISLSSENNSITLSEDGIGFPDLEPGYLYVNSDGILTTRSSALNNQFPIT